MLCSKEDFQLKSGSPWKIASVIAIILGLALLIMTIWFSSPSSGPPSSARSDSPDGRIPTPSADVRGRSIFWAGDPDKPKAALTFDDGPDPRYTPKILEILDHYGVKATFFLVGGNAERNPDVVRQIVAKGHVIGNHTYSHKVIGKLTEEQKVREIERTSEVLGRITGKAPAFFRSPYGYFDTAYFVLADRMGMTQVMWSVVPEDWTNPGAAVIARRVLDKSSNGSIILLHDAGGDRSQLVEALPAIIEGLRKKGLELVTVPELLGVK